MHPMAAIEFVRKSQKKEKARKRSVSSGSGVQAYVGITSLKTREGNERHPEDLKTVQPFECGKPITERS